MLELPKQPAEFCPMITISIVDHGHGAMLWRLVDQLRLCPQVGQIIVTLNLPDVSAPYEDEQILILRNKTPKGFGANHNAAFKHSDLPFFGVLNPDITLKENPFPALLAALVEHANGLVAPKVVNAQDHIEDSMRRFISPQALLKRKLGIDTGECATDRDFSGIIFPDWVAGMFMLFKSDAYRALNGFDEAYFMYCEDTDICTRLWQRGRRVVGCWSTSVVHQGQRASRKQWRHFIWHVQSLMLYWAKFAFRFPEKQLGQMAG